MPRKLRVAAAALMALAGCRSARMPVPASLSGVEPLAVEGRQALRLREQVRFGAWETQEVKRSWTRSGGLRIGPAARERHRQEYAFALRSSGVETARVQCETTAVSGGLVGRGGSLELQRGATLDCEITPTEPSADRWLLRLGDDEGEPMRGAVTNGPLAWTIEGTAGLEGGLDAEGVTGFEVKDGERTIAAVEVVHDGAVWLVPDIAGAERERLAAVAMALLLWRDVSDGDLDGQ